MGHTTCLIIASYLVKVLVMGWEGGGGVVAKLVFVNPQIQLFFMELGHFWQHLRLDGMSSRKKG